MSTDLLVEPSSQSRGQRILTTVVRSREFSIAIVLRPDHPCRHHPAPDVRLQR